MKTIAKPVVVSILIFALGIVAYPIGDHFVTKILQELRQDEDVLDSAEIKRKTFAELQLQAAIDDIEGLLARQPRESLDRRARLSLSRVYSDLAWLRYMRGLSQANFPEKAFHNAVSVLGEANQDDEYRKQAELALAYSYLAIEATTRRRLATAEYLSGLRASARFELHNIDLHYLSLFSDERAEASNFFLTIDLGAARNIKDVRILAEIISEHLEVAMLSGTNDNHSLEVRINELFSIAKSRWPDNHSILSYLEGQNFYRLGDLSMARASYKKALQGGHFPRASTNLGNTYAAQGDYESAVEYYQRTLLAPDKPLMSKCLALTNIASAKYEMRDDPGTCLVVCAVN